MTNTDDAPTLTDQHAEIIGKILDGTYKSGRYVEATNNPEHGAPFSTLRAMERRGLVRVTWKREGMIHTSDKPYRAAKLTDAGERAYRARQEA